MVPDYGKTHHENHVWNVGERSGHTELPPRAAQGSRLQAGRAAEPLRTASQLRCRSRGQGGGRRRGREGGGAPSRRRCASPAPPQSRRLSRELHPQHCANPRWLPVPRPAPLPGKMVSPSAGPVKPGRANGGSQVGAKGQGEEV